VRSLARVVRDGRALQRMPDEFRTGWFVESLPTELVIALIVRTQRPFFRSRPGALMGTVVIITGVYIASTEVVKASFYRHEIKK
jgi:hypothetical protein